MGSENNPGKDPEQSQQPELTDEEITDYTRRTMRLTYPNWSDEDIEACVVATLADEELKSWQAESLRSMRQRDEVRRKEDPSWPGYLAVFEHWQTTKLRFN